MNIAMGRSGPGDDVDPGVHGPGNSDCDRSNTANHMLRYRARDTRVVGSLGW